AQVLHHAGCRLIFTVAGDFHAPRVLLHLEGATWHHQVARGHRGRGHHSGHSHSRGAHGRHAHPCTFHHHVDHCFTPLEAEVGVHEALDHNQIATFVASLNCAIFHPG